MQLNVLKMQVNTGYLAIFWQFPRRSLSPLDARFIALRVQGTGTRSFSSSNRRKGFNSSALPVRTL